MIGADRDVQRGDTRSGAAWDLPCRRATGQRSKTLTESANPQTVSGDHLRRCRGVPRHRMSGLKVDLSNPTVTCGAATFTRGEAGAQVTASVSDAISGAAAPTVTAPATRRRSACHRERHRHRQRGPFDGRSVPLQRHLTSARSRSATCRSPKETQAPRHRPSPCRSRRSRRSGQTALGEGRDRETEPQPPVLTTSQCRSRRSRGRRPTRWPRRSPSPSTATRSRKATRRLR